MYTLYATNAQPPKRKAAAVPLDHCLSPTAHSPPPFALAAAIIFLSDSVALGFGLRALVSILGFVLWILLMIKAYQGERYRLPIAADLADQLFGKS
jgi:hypothetical protein